MVIAMAEDSQQKTLKEAASDSFMSEGSANPRDVLHINEGTGLSPLMRDVDDR